jgi:polyisoprenoid-binding protein YceI
MRIVKAERRKEHFERRHRNLSLRDIDRSQKGGILHKVQWILLPIIIAVGATLSHAAENTRHAIDVQHSKITVYVYKRGLFSFLADNHEIDAPITAGWYDSATNAVDVTVDATKMKALDPNLAPDRRATVQSNMTGPQVLDAAKYPAITFHSTKIDSSDANHWAVTGDLTLHGQSHPVTFDVVKVDAEHFTGSASVRQTAFGITPIRIAGGAVSVRDDVKVDFQVALTP